MVLRELGKGVYSLSAVDWHRRYFDELIPLPEGTSYNAYIVRGRDKTALLDTVDPRLKDELFRDLESLGVDRIDYVISHHAEQDHSGAIPEVLKRYPEAQVVTNEKCKGFLQTHLHIPEERFMVVGDGHTVDLGGLTLKFLLTPWVHWPETMVTYLKERGILFTCDLFGSHLATSSLYASGDKRTPLSAKRYYAEIMMPFGNHIIRHLKRFEGLEIKMIAPSHGPVHDRPEVILESYRQWTSDEVKNLAVVVYVSMHGSTKVLAERLVKGLMEKGVEVKYHDIMKMDLGEYAMDLVDAATVVLATPTVLTGPHPHAVAAAYLTGALRPKVRYFAMMGSYGWGGRAPDVIKENLKALKVEILGEIMVKGLPREEDLKAVDELAEKIAERHSQLTSP